jgi:ABC-type multidrug transport system permease subunit
MLGATAGSLRDFAGFLPLTALNDTMRAVMNEGAGLLQVAPQMALLAVTAAVTFGLAVRLFRWS